jgi:hypothetical protein
VRDEERRRPTVERDAIDVERPRVTSAEGGPISQRPPRLRAGACDACWSETRIQSVDAMGLWPARFEDGVGRYRLARSRGVGPALSWQVPRRGASPDRSVASLAGSPAAPAAQLSGHTGSANSPTGRSNSASCSGGPAIARASPAGWVGPAPRGSRPRSPCGRERLIRPHQNHFPAVVLRDHEA